MLANKISINLFLVVFITSLTEKKKKYITLFFDTRMKIT